MYRYFRGICFQDISGNDMKQSSTLLDEYYLQDKTEEASAASSYEHMVSVINKFPKEVKVVL